MKLHKCNAQVPPKRCTKDARRVLAHCPLLRRGDSCAAPAVVQTTWALGQGRKSRSLNRGELGSQVIAHHTAAAYFCRRSKDRFHVELPGLTTEVRA